MGNLTDPSTRNSILETAELKKYTGNLSTYPLPSISPPAAVRLESAVPEQSIHGVDARPSRQLFC